MRAEIASRGYSDIADTTYRGQQAFGLGIGQGIANFGQAIGAGLGEAGQLFAKNKAKLTNAYGKIDAWGQMGIIDAATADRLSSIKDPDKLQGEVSVIEQNFQNQLALDRMKQNAELERANAQFSDSLQRGRMDHGSDLRKAEMAYEQHQQKANNRAGELVVLTDPVTGKKHSGYRQNNTNVVLFPGQRPQQMPSIHRVDMGNGQFAYMDQDGNTVNPRDIQGGPDGATQRRIDELKRRQAELAGTIASDGKDGGKFLWFGKTHGEEKAAVDAELAALLGEGAPQAAAPASRPQGQPAAGGANKEQRKQAILKDYADGKISREEATKALLDL